MAFQITRRTASKSDMHHVTDFGELEIILITVMIFQNRPKFDVFLMYCNHENTTTILQLKTQQMHIFVGAHNKQTYSIY